MAVKGLTDRQLAWLRTNYFIDTVRLQVESGQGADGGTVWEDVGDPPLTPCRGFERNVFGYTPQGVDQNYDTVLSCGGETPIQNGGPKYRGLWTTYKQDPDSPDGDPIPDRERTLLVLSVDPQRDGSGAHVFQNLRCKSA